mgnify:CR=1 FL=1
MSDYNGTVVSGKVDQEIKYRKELEDMSIPPFPILVNSHFTQ